MNVLKTLSIHICICMYVVVKTREFSENKVLNIVNVELKQLKLHLLPHVVTVCFTYVYVLHICMYVYIYIYVMYKCFRVLDYL